MERLELGKIRDEIYHLISFSLKPLSVEEKCNFASSFFCKFVVQKKVAIAANESLT